ncbi:MAG: DUF6519 domain-containing protein [Candidatus Loosdrechtia sp.]|uniref:DUF6519 domain-containing protein n=1 Tax=Candidatus Loosdrechtia sp. TaxID=3101272 RepID=UPI003A6963AE|nr:MAG: right-handed parallel beta-helix repeat-containing protein [Candidatus Jettenia sp. AMX2]
MKGDFSKPVLERSEGSNFTEKKNFHGVLHQQGRVLLDSDWNAQTQIINDWQDTAGRDVIGTGVAAIPSDKPDGFKVMKAEVVGDPAGDKVKITVKTGRAWADGILVNLNGEPDAERTATYLQPPIQDPPFDASTIGNSVRDAVILEVWREEMNGFQMPDELIEPALGGPDTTERIHTAKVFRLLRLLEAGDTCNTIGDKLKDDPSKKGKLKVTLQPTREIDGECPVVEGGGYTGFEHNLYRIEIAKVKSGSPAMFKWSQMNGGLVGRGRFDDANKKVTITANLQAIITSGLDGFYLEAVEYDADFGHWKVTYGAEVTLNSDNEIELPVTEIFGSVPHSDKTVFFRLWNGIRAIADFPEVTAPAEPNELRDGIRLEFEDPSTASYVDGDYWIFPVRAGEIKNEKIVIGRESGGIIVGEPPAGIVYHRVPLAILNWNSEKDISFHKKEIHDCRDIFRPLTKQSVCCTITVGDGKSSHGDFDSIEEALRHLPDSGGEICLLPGLHQTNALIEGKSYIKIRGCDKKTKVTPGESNRKAPVFHVKDSKYITLETMDMITLEGTAILLEGTNSGKLQEVEIHGNRIQAYTNAVRVEQGQRINIHHNKIQMWDKEDGDVAIYMQAEDSVIERNDISVIPAESATPPKDVPGADVTPDPADPCADAEKIYRNIPFFLSYTNWVWSLQAVFIRAVLQKPRFKTPGGIQIGGESERIRIHENRIAGGSWNGITLGHIPSGLNDLIKDIRRTYHLNRLSADRSGILQNEFKSFLYRIDIGENEIRNMGLNGIGVVGFFSLARIGLMVSVSDLTIYRNFIENCLQQIPEEIPAIMGMEMGFGGVSLSDCENLIVRENRIENNGTSHLEPVSGIFILHGEKIDISDNRILNNGPRISENDANARQGMRGGIVVGLSFKSAFLELYEEKEYLSPDGIPAVKVHDNIVTQPFGQALFIMTLGPVSVIGNHLTSQGADFRVNPTSLLAGSVFILNFGASKDLVGRLLSSSFKNMARVNTNRISTAPVTGLQRVLYMPGGNVLFANNQTTLDLRSPEINFALSSQFIASLDDVSYAGNQSECTSFLDIVLANSIIYAVTVRTNDNRFQEGFTQTLWSLFSYGFMNTAATNQSTHCLHVLGTPAYRVFAGNTVLIPKAVVLGKEVNCEDDFSRLQGRYGVVVSHQ